jgi:hypothetical protein
MAALSSAVSSTTVRGGLFFVIPKPAGNVLTENRAMQLAMRRLRATSRALRARLRAEQLACRRVVDAARALRAFVLASKAIDRARQHD